MHGITTAETIPEPCRTQQAAWDELISGIWRSVLEPFCKSGAQTAIEIGPGTSCKIALALAKWGFTGGMYIVDASKNAAVTMEKKYKEYCPAAQVTSFHQGLRECLPSLPRGADLLLLSHAVDDMLMFDATLHSPLAKEIFDWCAHAEYALAPTKLYHEVWRDIEKRPDDLGRSKDNVLKLLKDMMAALKPKVLVMSQYPSATLDENGLGSMNAHTQDIFAAFEKTMLSGLMPRGALQSVLDGNKNYNHDHIGNNILNAANWLAYSGR